MKKLLPLLFAISIFTTACRIQPIVPKAVENVKFGTVDALKGLVTVDLGLKINNPNNFSVTVYGMNVDVSIDGISLGSASVDQKMKIEKNTEQVYPVHVNAKLTDIIGGIPKILSAISKKQSNVDVKGSVRVGSGIARHTFPFNLKQGEVKTEQKK